MSTTSPPKRRVLGVVDGNTRSPLPSSRLSPSKLNASKTKVPHHTTQDYIKRPVDLDGKWQVPSPTKRRRLSGARSEVAVLPNTKPTLKESVHVPSPASTTQPGSSLSGNPAIGDSHVPTITQPDVRPVTSIGVESRARPRSMTREETWQKTEQLRLRLGLASYKVKTNQADVPLERLQIRPVPRSVLRPSQSRLSSRLPLQPPPGIARPTQQNAQPTQYMAGARADREADETHPNGAASNNERGACEEITEATCSFASLASTESNPSCSGEQDKASKGPEMEAGPVVRRQSINTNTPERQIQQPGVVVGEGAEDGGRDGAAEGLLSLSQSSPPSGLSRGGGGVCEG
ncbi:hypothetical protein F5Y17DRAFT_461432 [Xylariaceae sp. FL0594]|nr:hypothetical protein F5Y17DRAFT_461432 [Xylariaceae sp. FL0594]